MSDYINGVRVVPGIDAKINYNSLVNKPVSDTSLSIYGAFADASITGARINALNDKISTLESKVQELENEINTLKAGTE